MDVSSSSLGFLSAGATTFGSLLFRLGNGVETGCKLKTIDYKNHITEVQCLSDMGGPVLNQICGSNGLFSSVSWLQGLNPLNDFAQHFALGTFFGRGIPRDICLLTRNALPPLLALSSAYKAQKDDNLSAEDKKNAWMAAAASTGVMVLAALSAEAQRSFQHIIGDPSGHVMMLLALGLSTAMAGKAASYSNSPALSNATKVLSVGLMTLNLVLLPNTITCFHSDLEAAAGFVWGGLVGLTGSLIGRVTTRWIG